MMAGGKRSDDDDTSKDRVMIQKVIREVGGGSSYPALTMTNYSQVEGVGSLEHHRGRRH
jgi:hypothetical protein